MDESSLIRLGQIVKIHGINSTFVIQTDNPSFINENTELVIVNINSQFIPFFIVNQSYRVISDDACFVTLDDIPTKERANELLNCDVYVEKIPEIQQSEHHVNFNQIVGFKVFDKVLGELGQITKWYNIPQNPLLEFYYQGKPILLPANEETIVSIDAEKKLLTANLPDGILNIN